MSCGQRATCSCAQAAQRITVSVCSHMNSKTSSLTCSRSGKGPRTLAAKGGAFSELIGIDHEVPIAPFMPVMMLAILFGLAMDYEVFLISRIREECLKDGDTRRAVADGLAKTARVITAAAAIMVVVFLAFLAAPDVFLKLFGIGLASAIFLDATVVRMVLVPAVMQLLGNLNWWIPNWLERILPRLDVEHVGLKPAQEPL
jgi:putative drug exporter of the RND superfamily